MQDNECAKSIFHTFTMRLSALWVKLLPVRQPQPRIRSTRIAWRGSDAHGEVGERRRAQGIGLHIQREGLNLLLEDEGC